MRQEQAGPRPLAPGSDARMFFDAAMALYVQKVQGGIDELTAKRHVASALGRALAHFVEQAKLPEAHALRLTAAPVGATLARLGASNVPDDALVLEYRRLAGELARLIQQASERAEMHGGRKEEAQL